MTDRHKLRKTRSRGRMDDGGGKEQRDQQGESDGKLAIRTTSKRAHRDRSTSSAQHKRVRLRPDIGRTASSTSVGSRPTISRVSSARSVRHLQIPHADDTALTSGDEADSVMGGPTGKTRISSIGTSAEDDGVNIHKPGWATRHQIYLDNEILSTTTSTQRPGLHKFQDLLLREQLEIRLLTPHNGEDAHFATRHATLRFWRRDGSLAEKWMDKDHGGEKEHEFALENMNDWTILQLSMGAEAEALAAEEEESDDDMSDTTAQTDNGKILADAEDLDCELSSEQDTPSYPAVPTMDIISHYISDYHDARNIASAPGQESDSDDDEDEATRASRSSITTTTSYPPPPAHLSRTSSGPVYHWVEIRRRNLEHQLRTYFHCPTTSCFNRGGTCLALSPVQHLHVGVKDLTDWSQQIAHSHRSLTATTIALVAKLVDDQVRSQDERLADVGREREDEDDLGLVLAGEGEEVTWLARLRPGSPKGGPVDLEMLE